MQTYQCINGGFKIFLTEILNKDFFFGLPFIIKQKTFLQAAWRNIL